MRSMATSKIQVVTQYLQFCILKKIDWTKNITRIYSRILKGKNSSYKGGNLSEIDRVIEVPPKVFNNKSCCNFGYEHKIAFCTAVQNLSQIRQPSFFTFSWGPPFAHLWIFVY